MAYTAAVLSWTACASSCPGSSVQVGIQSCNLAYVVYSLQPDVFFGSCREPVSMKNGRTCGGSLLPLSLKGNAKGKNHLQAL